MALSARKNHTPLKGDITFEREREKFPVMTSFPVSLLEKRIQTGFVKTAEDSFIASRALKRKQYFFQYPWKTKS